MTCDDKSDGINDKLQNKTTTDECWSHNVLQCSTIIRTYIV